MSQQEQEPQTSPRLIRLGAQMTIRNAVTLRAQLLELVSEGEKRDLILDLSGVADADASGLAALLEAFTAGQRLGRKVFLYQPTPKIRLLLDELDLTGFFPLVTSKADLITRLPD